MRIIINTTDDNQVRLYLMLWQGALRLTDAEFQVLEAIVKRYLKLKAEGINESYIPELLFNTKARKELQQEVKYSQHYFNNVVKLLKDKKIITPVQDTYYISDRRVIPTPEITFKFVRK